MEFKDNKPIYLQLAEKIMDSAPGPEAGGETRLLSVREYAAVTGVNPNTVNRAYTWLQEQGIIYNRRGIGYFFEEDACQRILERRRHHFIETEIPEFVRRWVQLGVPPQLFADTYRSLLPQPPDSPL